jgi:hypothetical protein
MRKLRKRKRKTRKKRRKKKEVMRWRTTGASGESVWFFPLFAEAQA